MQECMPTMTREEEKMWVANQQEEITTRRLCECGCRESLAGRQGRSIATQQDRSVFG